jgi:hypothetical protein
MHTQNTLLRINKARLTTIPDDEFHPPTSKSAQKSSKETIASRNTTKSASPALDAKIKSLSLAQARAQKHGFTAEVFIKGLPHDNITTNNNPTSTSTSKTNPNNDEETPSSANDTPMPDTKTSTPDRGIAHTVANALTNVLSAVTASATAAADKVATATGIDVDGLTTSPKPAGENSVLITRPDGSKKVESLRCLFCEGEIED